jgi:hypothetical protein
MSDVDDLLAEIEGSFSSSNTSLGPSSSVGRATSGGNGGARVSDRSYAAKPAGLQSYSAGSSSSKLSSSTSAIGKVETAGSNALPTTSSAVPSKVISAKTTTTAGDDLLDELLDMTSDTGMPGRKEKPLAAATYSSSSVAPRQSGAGATAVPNYQAKSSSGYSSKWDDDEEEGPSRGAVDRKTAASRGGGGGESKHDYDYDDDDDGADQRQHARNLAGATSAARAAAGVADGSWSSTQSRGSAGSASGGGGKCSNLCLAPDLPPASCVPGVYRPSAIPPEGGAPRRTYCDRLQCADCDFAVLRFPGGMWWQGTGSDTSRSSSSAVAGDDDDSALATGGASSSSKGVNYMFFRNHVPDREKLQTMIVEQEGESPFYNTHEHS